MTLLSTTNEIILELINNINFINYITNTDSSMNYVLPVEDIHFTLSKDTNGITTLLLNEGITEDDNYHRSLIPAFSTNLENAIDYLKTTNCKQPMKYIK